MIPVFEEVHLSQDERKFIEQMNSQHERIARFVAENLRIPPEFFVRKEKATGGQF